MDFPVKKLLIQMDALTDYYEDKKDDKEPERRMNHQAYRNYTEKSELLLSKQCFCVSILFCFK